MKYGENGSNYLQRHPHDRRQDINFDLVTLDQSLLEPFKYTIKAT